MTNLVPPSGRRGLRLAVLGACLLAWMGALRLARIDARDGEAKDGEAKDGEAKDGEAKDGEAKDVEAKEGDPKERAAQELADRVMGPVKCAACHEDVYRIWRQTRHYVAKRTLFSPKGREIAKKLGVRGLVHKSALCRDCHTTMYSAGGARKARAEWGVSCESCHGGARDWITVHGSRGIYASRPPEPEAHKARRLAAAIEGGMKPPSDPFRIVSTCMPCHLVPREDLVNVGGHAAADAGFEVLAWSQGEMRHRLLRGKENAPAPPERRRVLHVVGQMADLVGSVRALARATKAGPYATTAAARIEARRRRLAELAHTLGEGLPGEALRRLLHGVPAEALRIDNRAALTKIADVLEKEARDFSARYADGKALKGIDALLPSATRGRPFPH